MSLLKRYSALGLLFLRASPASAFLVLVFLDSSAYTAVPVSYFFASIAPPQWRSAFSRFAPAVKLEFPVFASGSNRKNQAVPPTAGGLLSAFFDIEAAPKSFAKRLAHKMVIYKINKI